MSLRSVLETVCEECGACCLFEIVSIACLDFSSQLLQNNKISAQFESRYLMLFVLPCWFDVFTWQVSLEGTLPPTVSLNLELQLTFTVNLFWIPTTPQFDDITFGFPSHWLHSFLEHVVST